MMERGEDVIVAAGLGGLAALFRDGATTPEAVLDAYLARIAARPALGAFVAVLEESARAEARESAARWKRGAPLSEIDGAPVAVKANIAVAGTSFHAGIGAYRDRIAAADAVCVANLRRAGAVIIGLTNMDEGAVGATGENAWFGRVSTPARDGYSAGGSSGGSAASVAAGLCAAALGTDTLGSVRIPAAFCGCVGYKPAFGMIPTEGVVPVSTTLDHVGVLARSVDDAVLLARSAGGRWDVAAMEAAGPGLLRVPYDVAPEMEAVLTWLAEALGAGAPIIFEEYDFSRTRRRGFLVAEIEAAPGHPGFRGEGFSEQFRSLMDWAVSRPEAAVAEARETVARGGASVRAALRGRVALCPTSPGPPHRFGEAASEAVADYTAPANLAGVPAFALPAGLDADGLPLSVQVMAMTEAAAVRMAREVERLLASDAAVSGSARR